MSSKYQLVCVISVLSSLTIDLRVIYDKIIISEEYSSALWRRHKGLELLRLVHCVELATKTMPFRLFAQQKVVAMS